MTELLDTSALFDDRPVATRDAAISVVTVAELRFSASQARDPAERRTRAARLSSVRARFDPIPVERAIAEQWGVLAALTVERGRQPRRRAMDLLIAATAQVHGLTLVTRDEDLLWLADVLDVRSV